MLLSLLASAAGAMAGLLFLASFLMSGAFTGQVPTGSNAVGLVVPLFCSIGAGLLLLVAAWSLLASGRLAWVGAHAGLVVNVIAFSVGASAVGVLLAWMERLGGWVIPMGWFCGGLAPMLAVILAVRCAWQSPAQLHAAQWPKLLAAPLLLSVLGAMVLALVGAAQFVRGEQDNQARALATEAAQEAESARRKGLSPVERLREDYAKMSPDTPLWVFVAGLPGAAETAQQQFIIARALQVPEFELALERTITDEHPLYRHGAVDLMRWAPASALKPSWTRLLARAITLSAEQIASGAQWLEPDRGSNPEPIVHLRSMIEAAQRLGGSAELDVAIKRLRASVEGLPHSTARDQALSALEPAAR